MKKILKSDEPSLLKAYRISNPHDNWKKQFRENSGKDGYKQIKDQLILDQKGVCAYCEIDLRIAPNGVGLDDFRVEHFHPENPHTPPPNHALDWNNMLGSCTGGNAKYVTENGDRFTNPDCSCDVPKGNRVLTEKILNPLKDIPAFPRLFSFIEQGEKAGFIEVDSENCPEALAEKAQCSIDELKLCSPRLNRFRINIIDKLREQISQNIAQGLTLEESLKELSEVYFGSDDLDDHWPAFFTTIRWYLADMAETQLQRIEYNG